MNLRVLVAFGDAPGPRQPGDVYEESEAVAAIRIKQGLCVPAGKTVEVAVIAADHVERAVIEAPDVAVTRTPAAPRRSVAPPARKGGR